MKWLKEHSDYRICQTQEEWIRNGKKVKQPKHLRKEADRIFESSLARCMITPSSVLIQRSLLDETGLFNENYPACEDYDLWLRVTKSEPVGLIDHILMTRYGGAPDQLSATVPVQDRYRIAAMESLLKEELTESQRSAVTAMICRKAEIVVNGCIKRGKNEEAEEFREILTRYL